LTAIVTWDLLAAAPAGASHPVVAGLLGIGAAGVAGGVVAMAWSVHVRQIRLAELLARRQFIVTGEAGPTARTADADDLLDAAANGAGTPGVVIIDGPDRVVTGDQARYRVRASGGQKVMSWAAGGGSVAQSPDPAHPDELLLVADRPGDLTVTVRVRDGMTERRATKAVTAVPEVPPVAPPVTLRLFLHGWSLVVVAVMIAGFAAALVALGNLSSADFIALVAPLAALLAVLAVARGTDDAPRVPRVSRVPHDPSRPTQPGQDADSSRTWPS
jgi:hypothetical protein